MGKLVYHWDDLRYSAFDNSTSLRLSAIAGAESFYYAIVDQTGIPCAVKGIVPDRKYHFFDKPLGYLIQLTSDDELLYADFSRVQIAVRGIPFVALRARKSDQETILSRLQEVTDISPSDEIFTDQVVDGIILAFLLPQPFTREVQAWFSDATISHVMSALMTHSIDLSRELEDRMMFINVTTGLTELFLCHRGQLLFANHYRTFGPEDVLYYTLAVLQNIGIQHDQIVIQCAGPGALNTLPVLQTYLPHAHLFVFPEIQPRSDYPQVDTVDLICVDKCAS